MRLQGRRVLITGAGGFVGSHLVEALVHKGARVRAFVHYNSRNDWGMLEFVNKKVLPEVEVITGDLRDSDAVRRAAKKQNVVFHLAALIGIPYSFVNPRDVVETNVVGSLNVLNSGLEYEVERIVHTSTSEVYGTAQYVPMDEKHPLNPQSPYAASKVAADQLALSFYRSFKLPVGIIRPFNIYGPRQSARAILPTIISQALKSNKITLGNFLATRDITFVTDTVSGLIAFAENSRTVGNVMNLGSGFEISIKKLVGLVAKSLNKKLQLVKDIKRLRPEESEVERLFSDSSIARRILGWKPEVTLEEGIARTIEWIRGNASEYKSDVYNI